jgi:hypothetical protein
VVAVVRTTVAHAILGGEEDDRKVRTPSMGKKCFGLKRKEGQLGWARLGCSVWKKKWKKEMGWGEREGGLGQREMAQGG